jgi:hypothetical protein
MPEMGNYLLLNKNRNNILNNDEISNKSFHGADDY